jgi:hypothetical protein
MRKFIVTGEHLSKKETKEYINYIKMNAEVKKFFF